MKPYGQVFLSANKKFYITCTRCDREIIDYNEFQNHVLVVHLDPLCTEKNENSSTSSFKEKLKQGKITGQSNEELLLDTKICLKKENVEKDEQDVVLSSNWLGSTFSDVEKSLKKEEQSDDDDQSMGDDNVSRYDFEDVNYELPEALIEINNEMKEDQDDVAFSDNAENSICEHCDKVFPTDILEKHKARKKCGPCPVCFYKYTDLYKHLKTNHIEYCEEKRRQRKAIIPGKGSSGVKSSHKKPSTKKLQSEKPVAMVTKEIPESNEDDLEEKKELEESTDEKKELEESTDENSDTDKIMCNYCGRSFSQKFFESHKARRKCGKCPVCFEVVPDVYAHVPNFHKEYSEEKRRLGEYVVKRLPIIGEKTFDKPDKILTCTYCEKVFKTELFYKQHVIKHEQFLNTCKECGMSFQYSSGLKKHLRKHTVERPFKCKICPASFNNDGSLKAHISNKHTIGQKVKCTFENCGKIFKNKERKRYHELYAHYNECKHLCGDCGLRFKTSGALNKHAKTVHLSYEDREFTCKFCNLKFAFKYELDPHEMMHLGQKRYLCEFCTKGYGKKSHLRRHCQSIHGRDID